jgi:hypothetical protein
MRLLRHLALLLLRNSSLINTRHLHPYAPAGVVVILTLNIALSVQRYCLGSDAAPRSWLPSLSQSILAAAPLFGLLPLSSAALRFCSNFAHLHLQAVTPSELSNHG